MKHMRCVILLLGNDNDCNNNQNNDSDVVFVNRGD